MEAEHARIEAERVAMDNEQAVVERLDNLEREKMELMAGRERMERSRLTSGQTLKERIRAKRMEREMRELDAEKARIEEMQCVIDERVEMARMEAEKAERDSQDAVAEHLKMVRNQLKSERNRAEKERVRAEEAWNAVNADKKRKTRQIMEGASNRMVHWDDLEQAVAGKDRTRQSATVREMTRELNQQDAKIARLEEMLTETRVVADERVSATHDDYDELTQRFRMQRKTIMMASWMDKRRYKKI